MDNFHFNYRDIFKISRLGFSGRKISVHLIGLLLGYLIYETLVYLSLLISGGAGVKTYWESYGLLPVAPFLSLEGLEVPLITSIAMWLGFVTLAAIFFLTSTMTSKITIEQLRGDVFFSVGKSLSFIKEKWKTVLGAFIGLPFLILLLLLIPVTIALLGKIPMIGQPILVFTSLFTPFGFLLGLLIAFLGVACFCSLFFVPAIVATTGADAFETVYQVFAILWNQPWRLIGYGILLFVLKLILLPFWIIFCFAGFSIAILPIQGLHPEIIQSSIGITNKWLGDALKGLSDSVQKIAGIFFENGIPFISTDIPLPIIPSYPATISAIFITITLIFVIGSVVAYLFSLASVGTTIIYSIVRKHVEGDNVLEVGETTALEESQPQDTGDE